MPFLPRETMYVVTHIAEGRAAVNEDAPLEKSDYSSGMEAAIKLKAQVVLGETIAIGPGKADLLEAISRTGSIAAAGRSLGFSYRRTRDMIDTLNACWKMPLVETVKGGRTGGGTSLTPAGQDVLQRYRALEAAVRQAAEGPGARLLALSGPTDQAAQE